MEYIEGRSLRRWASDHHEPDEQLAVLVSAAKGLEAAHAADVIHRDFKPENVMVTDQGQARIVDFGLAYRTASKVGLSQLARRGSFGFGTAEYMAPEARVGRFTAQSDQFSFAVTAWELLTGTRPFTDPAMSLTRAKPETLAGADRLSRAALASLSRALRVEEHERFGSITELRAALEGGSGGLGRIAAFVGGAAAVGALVTGAYFAGKHSNDQDKK